MKNKKLRFTLLMLFALFSVSFSMFFFGALNVRAATETTEYALQYSDYPIDESLSLKAIYDVNGKEIKAENGKTKLTDYGKYKIVYNEKTVVLNVYQKPPKVKFSYSSVLPEVVSAGEYLFIPESSADSGIRDVEYTDITVKMTFGDEISEVKELSSVFIAKSGKYTLEFSVTDVFGREQKDVKTITAEDRKIISGNLPSAAYYGETIDLTEVFGYYKETKYAATFSLLSPSGMSSSPVGKFVPTEKGTYCLTAKSVVDGENIEKTYKISVTYSSSALFTDANGIEKYLCGVSQPSYSTSKKKGIEIFAKSSGSSVKYAKTIPLSSLGKDKNLIEYQVVSSSYSEVRAMRITLIDGRDYSNKVSFYTFFSEWAHNVSYALIEFDGQSLGINNERYFEGIQIGYPRPLYGTVLYENSFYGKDYNGVRPFSLQYDPEEKALYTYSKNKQQLLLDLDDESALSRPWKGFGGDEIYLEIEFADTSGGSVIVTEIARTNFEDEIIDAPKDENLITFTSPEKEISAMPDGAVGYGYKIPKPYGKNLFLGDIDVTAKLTHVDSGENVTAKLNDFAFVPDKTGNYSAEYSGRDMFGNVIVRKVPFRVNEKPNPITIENIKNEKVTAGRYYKIKVPEVSGGSGKLSVRTEIVYNGRIVTPEDGNYILADKSGKIKIITVATDEIGYTASGIYEVKIDDAKPRLIADGLPDVAYVGDEITFDGIIAKSYGVNGEVDLPVKIYLGENLLSGEVYCIENEGELIFTFVVNEGTEKEMKVEKKITVIGSDETDVEKIFSAANEASLTLSESGMKADLESGESLNIPNPVADTSLTFGLSVLSAEIKNFGRVYVKFEDFKNRENAVEISFGDFKDGRCFIYVNGVYSGKTCAYKSIIYKSGAISGKEAYTLEYVFDPFKRQLKTMLDIPVAEVNSVLSGVAFKGFDSHAVRVGFGFAAQKRKASVILSSIANQFIDSASLRRGDRTGPTIAYGGEFGDETRSINDVYTLLTAKAYDVLSSGATVTAEVLAPDGSVVYSGDVSSPRDISLNCYGYYAVRYVATDKAGNKTEEECRIRVKDEIPPVVIIGGEIRTKYKKGDSLELPRITALDNLGRTVAKVYVVSPKLKTELVTADGYTFSLPGVYTLVVSAHDESYNYTSYEYSIEVE